MDRTSVVNGRGVRNLAALTGLSCMAIGRLISLVRNGRPHWFQEALTAAEFVVPAVFFGITGNNAKAALRAGR